jgi:hypothetical protein
LTSDFGTRLECNYPFFGEELIAAIKAILSNTLKRNGNEYLRKRRTPREAVIF